MLNIDSGIRKEVLERARQDKVKFINLQFADIHGQVKSATLPFDQLSEVLDKGIWFDGSSIEGFTRICESDMYLQADPTTYALLPWIDNNNETARLICDIYTPEGQPFAGDPRYVLKRVLRQAQDLGLKCLMGPELEFFLFKKNADNEAKPIPTDSAGYFDYGPRDSSEKVRQDIIFALQFMGLEVEMGHHEVAHGQHEIAFKYGDALTQADWCNTFKYVVKYIANKHGLHATFMPKPVQDINGSGMHVHQSLIYNDSDENAFYDENDEYKLSHTAKHFIAGQLSHARAFCGITAPTVNSYKRLVPGFEAPVYICWAAINRSALIRIPRYSPGRGQSMRCELRCPDPSCNPYLAFAVMLAAGLDGIRNETPLPDPIGDDVYELSKKQRREKNIESLPASLLEAIVEMEKDSVIMEALGSHVTNIYLHGKRREWDEYHSQVTPWELDTYFNRL